MEKEKYELFKTDRVEFVAEIYKYENCLNFLIESNGFKGHGAYYFVDVKNYINQLTQMLNTLSGECCIFDTESTNKIKLFFKNIALFVKGTIGDYETHLLSFSFRADQTLLGLLITALKKLS